MHNAMVHKISKEFTRMTMNLNKKIKTGVEKNEMFEYCTKDELRLDFCSAVCYYIIEQKNKHNICVVRKGGKHE